MKKSLLILTAVALFFLLTLTGYAEARETENEQQVLCIARDGDRSAFPAGSLQAVKKAMEDGANAVSVGVRMTADGVPVILRADEMQGIFAGATGKVSEESYEKLRTYRLTGIDGSETDCAVATLEEAMQVGVPLILDGGWAYREQIVALAEKVGAKDRIFLRERENAEELGSFCAQNGIGAVGIYYGNIVFRAVSYIEQLCGQHDGAWVQLQSGNYFSVNFQPFVMKHFKASGRRAVCAMYDGQLCGKRTDTVQGFDDMIGRGYSVIETDQPGLLINYIRELESEREELKALCRAAEKRLTAAEYAKKSRDTLQHAAAQASERLGGLCSKLDIEQVAADIKAAIQMLGLSDGEQKQLDVLSVTPGKVAAVLIFGAAVVAWQIYVYKKRKH